MDLRFQRNGGVSKILSSKTSLLPTDNILN